MAIKQNCLVESISQNSNYLLDIGESYGPAAQHIHIFLVEYVKHQFRLCTLVVPCWMEASWLPTVLNMLEDIPHQFSIVTDLIVDVSVSQILKDLILWHLTLWLLRDACYEDKGSLSRACEAVVEVT